VLAKCVSFQALSFIGTSCGLIIMAHTWAQFGGGRGGRVPPLF